MKGARILRYVGNREKPEAELFDPLERMTDQCGVRSQADFALDGNIKAFYGVPDPLYSDFEKKVDDLIYTSLKSRIDDVLFSPSSMLCNLYGFSNSLRAAVTSNAPVTNNKEVDFEVNMMEALVGWKSWSWDSGKLKSNGGECIWHPDEATKAKCKLRCNKVPAEHHTCGIYGAESRYTAKSYGEVLGLIYGWGRYIRHASGWKAQFAYPKCFYLKTEQMNLIEYLKQYHVPIYVSQPVKMYDPSEEGFDGYWTEEENGDCGAPEVSPAFEEGDPGEDDED